MKILKFPLLALLALAAFWSACDVESSADVNQARIYQDYELFYNSNTDKTWVIARYRFGGPTGSLLQLADPASVTFNGEVVPFSPIFGGHQREFPGRADGGTFVYTNTIGEVYTNSVPVYESIQFPTDLDTLSRSSASSITWEGTALKENQLVGLFIGSWTFGDDALFIQTGAGETDIVMGTDQLGNLPTGTSTLFMDRSTDVPLTEGTEEGGRIRGKFRALNKQITVVN
ncbi:MAG: hypothetical protein AAF824_10455 [Bacteroidota bacterium]